jgi:hypothetical protein
MNRDRQAIPRAAGRRVAVRARSLLGTVLLLGLAACGKQADPLPPQSLPRPLTMNWGGGSVHTADMQLSARPMPVSPGEM